MLTGHTDHVWRIAWSPDGTLLASASSDATVRVWDVQRGAVLHVLAGHTNIVEHVAWHPNGSLLASTSEDDTVRLWDTRAGTCVGVLPPVAELAEAVWLHQGALLAVYGWHGEVQMWRVADTTLVETIWFLSDHTSGWGWSRDEQSVAILDSEASVVLVSANGPLRRTLWGHQGLGVHAAVWSPDGWLVASAGYDGTVHVWLAECGQPARILRHGPDDTSVYQSRGRRMARCWRRWVNVPNSNSGRWSGGRSCCVSQTQTRTTMPRMSRGPQMDYASRPQAPTDHLHVSNTVA